MGVGVVLNERREQCCRNAEPNRTGRNIDIVGVLGTRGIGLHTAERTEIFHLPLCLAAKQIHQGMKNRARVRLDGNSVLRPQHIHVERGQQGHRGSTARLMAAYLQPVA